MRPPQTTVRNFFHSGRRGREMQGTPRETFGSIPCPTTTVIPAKAGIQCSVSHTRIAGTDPSPWMDAYAPLS